MNTSRERDLRLDFCRGFALIVIFIDHVPDNPLSHWTLRNFFFCDAAEIFVLISGMTTYLAYGSRFDEQGFLRCTKAIAKRWVRVYFAHLILFAAVAGFVITISQHFFGANYIDSLKLNWLVQNRQRALLPVLTLAYLPRLLDILPLYLILLGIAPLLILTVKRDYRVALLISGAVYATIWFSGWNLKAGEGRDWYFDPFAWQFLYALGMVLCHLSRTAPQGFVRREHCLRVAIGFLVFALFIAWPANGFGITRFAPLSYLWPADKTFLSPLRVINVVALLYVFGFFVSPQAPWLKSKLAELLRACGRHSLPVYGFGVVLSCVGFVVMSESHSKSIANLLVNLFGILLLLLLAEILDWHRQNRLVSRSNDSTSIARSLFAIPHAASEASFRFADTAFCRFIGGRRFGPPSERSLSGARCPVE
jgi:hypothetical protein